MDRACLEIASLPIFLAHAENDSEHIQNDAERHERNVHDLQSPYREQSPTA
jgi:hypothetical protein